MTKRPKFRIDEVEVRFESVQAACEALGLPKDKVFRRELKRRGHMIYEHKGVQRLFTVVPRREPEVYRRQGA